MWANAARGAAAEGERDLDVAELDGRRRDRGRRLGRRGAAAGQQRRGAERGKKGTSGGSHPERADNRAKKARAKKARAKKRAKDGIVTRSRRFAGPV
jgi:hypothetical protein